MAEQELQELAEQFDIVETLEHQEPQALAQLDEGSVAEVDGTRYKVEEYGTLDDGTWYFAGDETPDPEYQHL